MEVSTPGNLYSKTFFMLWLSVGPTGSALNNCSKQWERANKRFSTLRRHRTRKVFYHGEDTDLTRDSMVRIIIMIQPFSARHTKGEERRPILDCSSTQYPHKERGQFVISLSFRSGIHARRWWLRSTHKKVSREPPFKFIFIFAHASKEKRRQPFSPLAEL